MQALSKHEQLTLWEQRRQAMKDGKIHSSKYCKNAIIRRELLLWQGDQCFYCDTQFSEFVPMQVEHLKARSIYGESYNLEDYVLSCDGCNAIKGAIDVFELTKEEIRELVRSMIRFRYAKVCKEDVGSS